MRPEGEDDCWRVVGGVYPVPGSDLIAVALKNTDTYDIAMELQSIGRPLGSLGDEYAEYLKG